MKLRHITFTGADDHTEPEDLVNISRDCQNVEWGILRSRSRAAIHSGTTRYPSVNWRNALSQAFKDKGVVGNLSSHLCGNHVRDLVVGNSNTFMSSERLSVFQRYQLNFPKDVFEKDNSLADSLSHITKLTDKQFIFQMKDSTESVFHSLQKQNIQTFPVFDQSGGNGVLPDTWKTPIDDVFCGYAGGLGPDNLEEQLKKLADIVGDREIWVDMESRIRNEKDNFDIDLVKKCIEIASIYF